MSRVSITLAKKLKGAGLTRGTNEIRVGDLFCSGRTIDALTYTGHLETVYEYEKVEALGARNLAYLTFHWYWMPTADDISREIESLGMRYRWKHYVCADSKEHWQCRASSYSDKNIHYCAESYVSLAEAAGTLLLKILQSSRCDDIPNENQVEGKVLDYTLRDILSFDDQKIISLLHKLRDSLITKG
jgi:hypothetical protein